MTSEPLEAPATPLLPALQAALEAAATSQRDAGAVALALRYAALLDDAVPATKYRDALRALRRAVPSDDDVTVGAYNRIADALSEHSVASDLGPKLLSVLTALGMTVTGRTGKGGSDVPRVPDELANLRVRAVERRSAR